MRGQSHREIMKQGAARRLVLKDVRNFVMDTQTLASPQ